MLLMLLAVNASPSGPRNGTADSPAPLLELALATCENNASVSLAIVNEPRGDWSATKVSSRLQIPEASFAKAM